MSTYDVIVVGAGPAGSFAAYNLAKSGVKVALIEKEIMPRRKPCGGGLSLKSMTTLPFDLGSLLKNECSEASFRYGNTEYEITTRPDSVWMVCRPEFDLFLAEQAAAAG